ncbi:MAG: zinc-dependent peptidase [Sandaracinaceae bacterium]|nr:zinc-dependent peptidase [Sandaracinaceae bacterium]
MRYWAYALGLGALAGVLLGLRFGLAVGLGAGAGIALAAWLVLSRRTRRRARLSRAPFPPAWRATLEEWVGYYRALEPADRRRFEDEVRWFVDEHVITGPRGAEIDDALKVLVAASAVVLIFGRPGFRYPKLRDIVIYDEAFDETYRGEGNILGMVHGQGPILFSARALRQGFRGDGDGHNVGYHEFAHVLDFDRGRADGVPGFMPWAAVAPWLSVVHAETARAAKGRSILRRYAAKNEAEFFAVATEVFFERPEKLRAEHPELYALLRDAYGQDPAR